MIAAADYAERKSPPPQILLLALDCEHYRALPYSGGVMDQPAGLLGKMRAVMNVYHAFVEYKNAGMRAGGMAKWRNENQEIYDIISEINRLRNG